MEQDVKNSIFFAMTNPVNQDVDYRRRCGCLRTSEKLKHILSTFPSPPPPTPIPKEVAVRNPVDACISVSCKRDHCAKCMQVLPACQPATVQKDTYKLIQPTQDNDVKEDRKSWKILSKFVHLVQLSITATALTLYYLIYVYMQVIYYTLRSALYFHNADRPMKVTIGVVTITSITVAFNVILKLERLIGLLK